MEVAPALTTFAMPFLIVASVAIQLFVTSGRRLNRIEALGLMGFYLVFAVSQFRPLPSLESILGF
jgi:Ca2+/Na+ antiporter